MSALHFLITILIFLQNTCQLKSLSKANSTVGREGSLIPLYLLVVLPYPQIENGTEIISSAWSGGPNVIPAIRLAAEHINNDSTVLGKYELKLIETNGGCNFVNEAFHSFLQYAVYSDLQIVGMVGPGCSGSSLALAALTPNSDMAMIHIHGAEAVELEDVKKYPYSFGALGSARGVIDALITLMVDREWNNVTVYYDSSRVFHRSTFDAFVRTIDSEKEKLNVNLSVSLAVPVSEDSYRIESLKEIPYKIVLLIASPKIARNTLCLAYHEKLIYPRNQWVLVEITFIELYEDVEFDVHERCYSCSRETMKEIALNGSILLNYRLRPLDGEANTRNGNGVSYNEFHKTYMQKVAEYNSNEENPYTPIEPSQWGGMFYDSVWAMAMGLNSADSLQEFDLWNYGKQRGDKPYGDRTVNQTLLLRKEVQDINFNGVSGLIRFNTSTQFTERPLDILQLINGQADLVAYYYTGNKAITHLSPRGIYSNNKFPSQAILFNPFATGFLILIIIIVLMVTVGFHCATLYYRHYQYIRASSPKLGQLAYIGCYVILLTSILLLINEGFDYGSNLYIIICHTIDVSASAAFTLLFATVCARTWRLYRIFNHSWKPGKLLSGRVLFTWIILGTIIDIIINILWIATDTFTIIRVENFEASRLLVTVSRRCTSKYFIFWNCFSFAYKSLFVFGAFILAILSRKIRMQGYQTKSVLMLTYTIFLIAGLGMPTAIITKVDTTISPMVGSSVDLMMLITFVVLSITFLFAPPVIATVNIEKLHFTGSYGSQRPAFHRVSSVSSCGSQPVITTLLNIPSTAIGEYPKCFV